MILDDSELSIFKICWLALLFRKIEARALGCGRQKSFVILKLWGLRAQSPGEK